MSKELQNENPSKGSGKEPIEKTLIETDKSKVTYFRKFITENYYFKFKDELPWQNEEVILYGKTYNPNRMTIAYGDKGVTYRYSGKTRDCLPYTEDILKIKKLVEDKLKTTFNFILFQYYPSGQSYISWHSDSEKDLIKNSIIASLTFNEENGRDFYFKNKETKEVISIVLKTGTLLVMEKCCQSEFLHSVPKRTTFETGRINLTFRQIKTK